MLTAVTKVLTRVMKMMTVVKKIVTHFPTQRQLAGRGHDGIAATFIAVGTQPHAACHLTVHNDQRRPATPSWPGTARACNELVDATESWLRELFGKCDDLHSLQARHLCVARTATTGFEVASGTWLLRHAHWPRELCLTSRVQCAQLSIANTLLASYFVTPCDVVSNVTDGRVGHRHQASRRQERGVTYRWQSKYPLTKRRKKRRI